MAGYRGLWRRWVLGLSTLAGRPRGFFIPHRYAAGLRPPDRYKVIEEAMASAAPEFRRRLAAAGRHLAALSTLDGPPPAPRFEQDWFPRLDAAIAYALVRDERPQRIVEVGSGHSTRFLARAIADGGLSTHLTAIDPEPRAALRGLAVEWIASTLQAADAAPFLALAPGDILFIDSSHVLMPGSDVDRVLGDILPRLCPGVVVHFHDIFLPDPYPESWSWRGYNEQNALAALLTGGRYRLLWSSHWAATRMAADVRGTGLDRLTLLPGAFESSLWIEKL